MAMKERDRGTVIVVTGPTASGKSALAVELARLLGTEVISADSRQVYKGIPIVTAQPTAEEMQGIRHHLVDMIPLDAYYSAASFEEDALRVSERLLAERGTAIVCGGSMMYVDAFCHGIDELPTIDDALRDALKRKRQTLGDGWLRGELRRLDPVYYSQVDLRNMARVFHAVEICLAAGTPYSEMRIGERRERDFRIVKVMLDGSRQALFSRINHRVDRMVELGFEEEARGVYPLKGLKSLNTVGLKEMFAWFAGEMDRHTAIERIKKNTRVYAKKQLTWFKRDESLLRVDFEDRQGALRSIMRRYEGNE